MTRTRHPESNFSRQNCAWLKALLLLAVVGIAGDAPAQTADSFNPGITGMLPIEALAVQRDGGVLAGGNISGLAGQPHYFLGRINNNGVADHTFSPFDSFGTNVTCVQILLDGKILVGGSFKRVCGQNRDYLARLHSDGNLDITFGARADARVAALALQHDGNILVGGAFTNLNGQTRSYLGRLMPDGTLDTDFQPMLDGSVSCIVLQPDGRMVVSGGFSNVNGQAATRLSRLNTDGSLDTNFQGSVNGPVWAMALLADGKLLVGGSFTLLAGQSRTNLGRLNADGSLDAEFAPLYSRTATSVAVQADGRIVLSGMSSPGPQSVTNIARFEPDGTLDTNFNAGAVGSIQALALQQDGKLIVAGQSFTRLAGESRTNIGRLNNTYGPTESLVCDGSRITWLRGGSSPEVWRTVFEVSDDGTNWTDLGAGERINGGWQLGGLSSATNSRFRALGMVVGGYLNRCGWPIESSGGPPWIVTQPLTRAVTNGQTVVFSVVASGSPELTYQWRRDGANLPGMTGNSLLVTNVSAANAGAYCVTVGNAFGEVVSASAILSVSSPATADSFAPSIQPSVEAIAIQPDGGILLGGGGLSGSGYLKRFSADGTADTNLNFAANNPVLTVAVQEDLKILVGGSFTMFNGQPRASLCRLHPSGSPDDSFSASTDGQVYCQITDTEGRVVIGGQFGKVSGRAHTNLARLQSDGRVDESFTAEASGAVYCFGLQEDGALVVGGNFAAFNGQARNGLARLLPDGRLDETFNPGSGWVYGVAVQADRRILVFGTFSSLGGQARPGLGRLNRDGTVDTTFRPGRGGTLQNRFSTLAVQSDGRIIVGGTFRYSVPVPGGAAVYYLGRLESDGSFDLSFRPAGDIVDRAALQADGKVLAAGPFTLLGGQTRRYIGRLNNTSPAVESLSASGSVMRWQRTGTGPEVSRVSLDATVSGVDWVRIGNGTRTPNGWVADVSSVPDWATLRVRGFVGGDGISAWFVEDFAFRRPLTILTGDNDFGIHAGQFGFNISGSPGQRGVVEMSTNLITWSGILTNEFGAAPQYAADPLWTNSPVRFYRLRSLQ